ncbi:MAG: glycosyltransferase [Gammaproteobacteria bacterium]|nr:MAG: glycosyltransferase [Gammaproteobacteria bacterium]
MKIGFCLFKYFPFGGLQNDFMDVAGLCAERGHEVYVYTRSWQGNIPERFNVRLIKSQALSNNKKYQRYHTRAMGLIRQDDTDLVVGFNKMPGLDVYFASDPCYKYQMSSRSKWHRLGPRYRHFIGFEGGVFDARSDTRILILSEDQKQNYQLAWQTPDSRFTLMPPGIHRSACADEQAQNHRQRIRQEFDLVDDDILLLMIGSGFKTKGLDRALHAIRSLPAKLYERVQLVVIGQDKAIRFEKQAAKMGLADKVRILPGRDDIPAVMQAGDLLVHPAYAEVAGKVILEAVVAGLPVLVTDVCGYAHHVAEARAGIVLSSPFKQKVMDEMLEMMLEDNKKRESWREQGIVYGREQGLYSLADAAVIAIEAAR